MPRDTLTLGAAIIAGALLMTQPAFPQNTATDGETPVLTGAQTKAIERLIHDYIVKNPDVLLEAQTTLEARAETQRVDVIRKHLAANADAVYRDASLPVAGNPKGDVTVVEFMDYNCPFCKKASADIAKLIADDPDVKVVFQEFANLGAPSEAVARIAMAANAQGRYYELHRALMDAKGPMTEVKALEIAAKLGLDGARLKRDAAADTTKAALTKAKTIAAKLHIQGTPMFLIGDKYISGVPENFPAELARHVAEVRKEGCKVC